MELLHILVFAPDRSTHFKTKRTLSGIKGIDLKSYNLHIGLIQKRQSVKIPAGRHFEALTEHVDNHSVIVSKTGISCAI
jgi:hypothetical protein